MWRPPAKTVGTDTKKPVGKKRKNSKAHFRFVALEIDTRHTVDRLATLSVGKAPNMTARSPKGIMPGKAPARMAGNTKMDTLCSGKKADSPVPATEACSICGWKSSVQTQKRAPVAEE